jgi:hypothetical protein
MTAAEKQHDIECEEALHAELRKLRRQKFAADRMASALREVTQDADCLGHDNALTALKEWEELR